MKRTIINCMLFIFAFLVLPLSAIIPATKPKTNEEQNLPLPETYKVLDIKTNKMLSLTPTEYITGVVSAEMPASFHKEALKAQAVAAHSYALYLMGQEGGVISTDSARHQAYFSKEERKDFYGKNFESYEEKITSAVSEVINEILIYNKSPVIAAFHSISSGKTENSEDIWGKSLPYLVSTDSSFDLKNPKSVSEKTFTKEEIKNLLGSELELKILSRTASGTVLKLKSGDKIYTGTEIRDIFSLNSSNFEIKYDTDSVTFTVYGYGHGVGMSQHGANYLANNGKSYKEILAHYYKGTELYTCKEQKNRV